MSRLTAGFLPLLLCGCGFFAGPRPELTQEIEAVAFAERIQVFYSALENLPLNALITFKSRELRGFFRDERAFSDYYAAMAGELRDASFKNARAKRVEIQEFHFDGPGRAIVDFVMVGDHFRALQFWDRELGRRDTWQQVGGVWLISPQKL